MSAALSVATGEMAFSGRLDLPSCGHKNASYGSLENCLICKLRESHLDGEVVHLRLVIQDVDDLGD
jgi:hypothetical protein